MHHFLFLFDLIPLWRKPNPISPLQRDLLFYEVSVNFLSLVFRVMLGSQYFTASSGPAFSFPNKKKKSHAPEMSRERTGKNATLTFPTCHTNKALGLCLPPLLRISGIFPTYLAQLKFQLLKHSESPAHLSSLLPCSLAPVVLAESCFDLRKSCCG